VARHTPKIRFHRAYISVPAQVGDGTRFSDLYKYVVRFTFVQAAHPVMYLLVNTLAFLFFLYLLPVLRDYRRRRGLPYPPGPPSRPIIGNLLDIPMDCPWTAYANMSKNYGRENILVTHVRAN
jgi:hypothetical protein